MGPFESASVNDRPLTTREVAEYLGFSLETVLRIAPASSWGPVGVERAAVPRVRD